MKMASELYGGHGLRVVNSTHPDRNKVVKAMGGEDVIFMEYIRVKHSLRFIGMLLEWRVQNSGFLCSMLTLPSICT